MSTIADPSALILARIVDAQAPALSEAGAREMLALDFPADDRRRMNALAAKAQDGELNADEQQECRAYEQLGHLLSLLHSKARLALRRSAE
ncbi:MAG TPA: hypothetical protein PKC18_09110 [Lacipirellulaceae bacterium]|nr:hypothetical protein [Lacipirellulaceae bacterium]